MTTRLYDPTTTGSVVRGILIVTMAVIVVGFLALVRATMGAKTDHVTVRVDNQTGRAVQIDALDHASARLGLGEAEPRTLRTFHEVPDIGAHWTITIPADASDALEQAGFQ
jgi:hypothetical protein